MNNFETTRDIANYYDEQMKDVIFPSQPEKPVESSFNKHASYGQALDDWEVKMNEYRDARKAYNREQSRIYTEFTQSVLSFLGLSEHPKQDILLRLAENHRDGEGLWAIAEEIEELSQLL